MGNNLIKEIVFAFVFMAAFAIGAKIYKAVQDNQKQQQIEMMEKR